MERPHSRSAPPASAGCETVRLRERDGLRASLVRFGNGLRIPRHHHDGACITVVLDGVFEETLCGRALRSEAGWVLAKPAGEPHTDHFGRQGSVQVIIEVDDDFAEVTGAAPSRIRHDRDPVVLAVATELARELGRPEDGFADLAVRGLSMQLLARHARLAHPRRDPPPWIRQVRDVLHERTARPPSLTELARLAGVHENHLIRQFQRTYDLTPAAYGRQARLEQAARALRVGDVPIATIALRCGFADQSHFTRWFRRHTGATPARYRTAHRRHTSGARAGHSSRRDIGYPGP